MAKFKKGESGNPKGRPVGSFSLTEMLRRELQTVPEGEDKKQYAELLVRKVMKMAIVDGNEQMVKLCWQYLDGMPRETVDMTLREGKPIYGGKSIQNTGHNSDPKDLPAHKED